MKRKPDLSIIIPVYNEAENIKSAIEGIKKKIKIRHEIIVVFDNEKDTTLPPLRKIQIKTKNLHIVKNKIIPGPSGAIRTGFAYAKADRILVTMADLCDDWDIVDKICKLIPSKADVVCPSRYMKGGGQVVVSKYKAFFPQTAGFLLNILSGIPTRDPTNSYKLYSRQLLETLNLKSTVSFSVTLEIMAKSYCLNKRIIEVPTVWHDRQQGKTNFKILPSIVHYIPWFCFALMKNRLFTLPVSIVKKAL